MRLKAKYIIVVNFLYNKCKIRIKKPTKKH